MVTTATGQYETVTGEIVTGDNILTRELLESPTPWPQPDAEQSAWLQDGRVAPPPTRRLTMGRGSASNG
jgi:hypothetical protein